MKSEVYASRKTGRTMKQVTIDTVRDNIIKELHDNDKYAQTSVSLGDVTQTELPDKGGWLYEFPIYLENVTGKSASQGKVLNRCKEFLKDYLVNKAKWEYATDKEIESVAENTVLAVPEKIEENSEHFEGIYERAAHLRIINAGMHNYVQTGKKVREHVLLYGQPAACKTKLFTALKSLYESEDKFLERVLVMNATTMSKAGFENFLAEKAEKKNLPDVLCVDEIEKAKPEDLSCLLEIMDGQGRVSKLKAPAGRAERKSFPCNLVVWATCNDVGKLKSFHSGALFSRFHKTLPCCRPSAELMKMILRKELEKWERVYLRPVNYQWIDIVMDYCKKRGEDDPRKILGYLNGGKRIEDKSYFQDLEDIESMGRTEKKLSEALSEKL